LKPVFVEGEKYLKKYGKLNTLMAMEEVEVIGETGDILLF